MKHNSTIDYYNRNAARYFNETVHADVSEIRDRFAQMLPPGGTILDLGCGSGRDSKAFIEQGFRVVAVDGSEKLCKLAQAYIQQPVVCSDFLDYKPNETFDGIWACASLLHLTEAECGRAGAARLLAQFVPLPGRWRGTSHAVGRLAPRPAQRPLA